MFKWLRRRRDARREELAPNQQQGERDSGEEEYESEEELEDEIPPSGITRAKTDNL